MTQHVIQTATGDPIDARVWPRRMAMTLAFAAAALLATISLAWACTSLATMDLDKDRAASGTAVEGSGEGFSSNPLASDVAIHFDSVDGPVLWSGPAQGGTIAFTFETPAAAPGHYVLIATQTNANGSAVYGTPARASFEVFDPAAESTGTQPPAAQEPAQEAPSQQSAPEPAQQEPAPAEQPQAAPAAAPAQADAPAAADDGAGQPPTTAEQPAAPAQAEEPASAPAPTAERTTTLEAPSQGPAILALLLVGIGGLLALGTTAFALGARRRSEAVARIRR